LSHGDDFLDKLTLAMNSSPGPLVVPWPMPGNPAQFVQFNSFVEWRDFILRLGLHAGIPLIVSAKFARAQKLHLVGWIDGDLIKAGELTALTALELALMDCYGRESKKAYGNTVFAHLLRYVVEHDGLTDDAVSMNRRCGGGAVIDFLTGKREPSLAQVRNDMAHGDPFDGFLWAGLLEPVRDVIAYAYRRTHPAPKTASTA
jgi:hypothetical protein